MADRYPSSKPRRPDPLLLSPIMARKSTLFKQTLFASAIFVITIYAFFTTFLNPFTESALPDEHSERVIDEAMHLSSGLSRVRIYMYDLPKRFNYGIIEQHAIARGATNMPVDDVSQLKYPGHQHMGEWYFFSDLLRPDSERVGSPVIKVLDPDEADLFYVPVFSSLSLIVNTRAEGSRLARAYSDEDMQDALVEWLEEQEYWKRNNGRDHVIIAGDPNALNRVINQVKNAVLLLSDFGRVRPDQGSLVKDVIIPYSHRINSYNGKLGAENRDTLLFFMGNRYRKEGGKIRDMLFKLLEKEDGVTIKHGTQSTENRRAATHGMHTSKFCLNPAGDTPSACRLFDAIVSLCIPVIVSDNIELPFEDSIDYTKIAVFVETSAALKPGNLVKMLRKVTPKRILEYQKQLREVKRYFEYSDANGAVNEIWRQVAHKLPNIKWMIHRDKRVVKRQSNEPDCSCICTNKPGIVSSL